jgi:hypothetical protein
VQAYAAAAPERPKSRLWIVWVVIGVVVVLLAIVAALVIPRIVGLLGEAAGGSAEDDAVSTVQLYDDAWNEADCEAYEASTTAAFREGNGIDECSIFAEEAAAFDETTDDYELEVVEVERIGDDTVVVRTVESYTSPFGEDGEELPTPESFESELEYTLVLEDGSWLIDDLA